MSGVTSAQMITKWGKSEDAACLPGAVGKGLPDKVVFEQKPECREGGRHGFPSQDQSRYR